MRFVFFSTVIFSALTCQVLGQGDMCGMMAPDPMKTCVSLRLPWQPQPIYFCVEKEKFRYRNQCSNRNMMNCGGPDMRNDTLILATPWDCCPYTSVADHCMHTQCPPMPLNRKCQMLNDQMMMDNSYNSWDCCPKYFCEEGTTPQNCHIKRLEPMCTSPPQGKMNCVGFHDQYGCCTKYQCDGDGGKAGMCPMQHQAMEYIMRYNTSHQMMMNNNNNMMSANLMMPPAAPPPPAAAAVSSGETEPMMSAEAPASGSEQESGDRMKRQVSGGMIMTTYNYNYNYPSSMQMNCIGDFNCPGNMKCCSHDINVYGDGRYVMKNMNPTHGYCVEPVMMMPMKPMQ